MFLVGHSHEWRSYEIRSWLDKHPSVSLLVAAAYFEWMVCRAILALSRRPNAQVRQDLSRVFGLEKYKNFWQTELNHLPQARRLPKVVGDWHAVTDAFDARNRLVHGRDRYTRNMATPRVEALLAAVSEIVAYCRTYGVDINTRLSVRRRQRPAV